MAAIRPCGLRAARWFPRSPSSGRRRARQVHIGGAVYKQIRRSNVSGRRRAGRRRSRRCRSDGASRRARNGTPTGVAVAAGRAAPAAAARRSPRAARALRTAVAQPQAGGDRPEDQWSGAHEQASRHGFAGYPPVPMDLGLQGRVALVTAASSGIGFGIAEALAAEGASVAVSSRTPERIEAAAERIGARPYVFDSMDLDAAPAADRPASRRTWGRCRCSSPTRAARRAASRSSSAATSGSRPTASSCSPRWR